MNREIKLEEVYQPAEDTLLLLKAALVEARPEDRAIEIGCGRALISRGVAPKVESILATDINPHAVRLAKEYGLEAVRADLFRGIEAEFDLVIFNPPYLPTSEEERIDGWLNYALDGGATGRDIISRFLEDLEDHLSPRGRALLLVSSVTGLDEVKEKARAEGLEATEAASDRYFFEQLYIIKLRVAHGSS
ncbi:MAG TPA: HemK2/MTQ2 family protein methyltransferase [Methanotrichaceae archaeon]|nr:HemK2/MTQ2 family protein methyltransferase [Methanotrichaceae archaeon]